MAKKTQFGIKYPFTRESGEKTYIDVNQTQDAMIKSRLLHTILTPKGQRVRMPDFGTDLIKYIFSPNDELSFSEIRNEISKAVSRYVPEVNFKNIEIISDNEEINGVIVNIKYDIQKGNTAITTEVAVKLT